MPTDTAASLFEQLRRGDRRALGRVVSELENGSACGGMLHDELATTDGEIFVVGLTGPPGAGKSTLVSLLSKELIARGGRVAVLLVDPSSPVTGGAVLGDRIRFSPGDRSPDLYVRSLGNRGQHGGVTAAISDVILAVRTAGFDTVIIETVGAGQSDITIVGVADSTICATPPGLGDSIQAMKAGIQEVADLFVVTKSDRPGADQLLRQLRAVPRRQGDASPRPVIATSSADVTGIADLADELERQRLHSDQRT